MEPSISESSGIPKRKKVTGSGDTDFAPLFTGQLFIVANVLPDGDSGDGTGESGQVYFPDHGLSLRLAARCLQILPVVLESDHQCPGSDIRILSRRALYECQNQRDTGNQIILVCL